MRKSLDWEENKTGDFGFHIKIHEFAGALQAEKFIDLLNEYLSIMRFHNR
jgi:hypothetical protein